MLSKQSSELMNELEEDDNRFSDLDLPDDEIDSDRTRLEERLKDQARDINYNLDRLEEEPQIEALSSIPEIRKTIVEYYLKYKSDYEFPDTIGGVEKMVRVIIKEGDFDVEGSLEDFCRYEAEDKRERESIYKCICIKEICNGE